MKAVWRKATVRESKEFGRQRAENDSLPLSAVAVWVDAFDSELGYWSVFTGSIDGETGTDYHKDDEKSQIDLLPADVLLEVGEVLTYGNRKYGPRNWEIHKEEWRWGQLLGSSLRHTFKWMTGEDLDVSGCHHLAHAIANLMMLLSLILHEQGTDDRSVL